MGNIGDSITPAVPPVGASGPGYATDIDAILTEVVARLSTKVPLSSLAINGDLSLSGNSLTNVANVVFANATGAPSGSPFSRWAVFNGDVYWVNAAGAIQLTTGATLNSAAIGGITGAYGGANPAQLRYDNVNTRYDLYANFGTATWAYCRALGFDIPGGATSTAFARLQWGGSSNVTHTLPAAMPAGNAILTIDNTGVWALSTNTAPATNSNITLSGTGTYKHGVKQINKALITSDAVALSGGLNPNTVGVSIQATTQALIRMPELPTHARLIDVTITFDSALNRGTSTGQVKRKTSADPGSVTLNNLGAAMSNTGTAKMTVTGLNFQPTGTEVTYVQVNTGANPAVITDLVVTYDIP